MLQIKRKWREGSAIILVSHQRLLQSNSRPKQPADHLHHSGGAALGRLGDMSGQCMFMEAVNHHHPPLTNT